MARYTTRYRTISSTSARSARVCDRTGLDGRSGDSGTPR
jgi:hypothetical protein